MGRWTSRALGTLYYLMVIPVTTCQVCNRVNVCWFPVSSCFQLVGKDHVFGLKDTQLLLSAERNQRLRSVYNKFGVGNVEVSFLRSFCLFYTRVLVWSSINYLLCVWIALRSPRSSVRNKQSWDLAADYRLPDWHHRTRCSASYMLLVYQVIRIYSFFLDYQSCNCCDGEFE